LEIVSNPTLVSLLLAKAKEHSPQAKQQPSEETAKDLLSLIQQNPGITKKELQEKYQEYSERRITTNRIRQILQSLSGKITIQTTKGVRHYFPKTQ
jgi:predicted HTH transcriptional regulator